MNIKLLLKAIAIFIAIVIGIILLFVVFDYTLSFHPEVILYLLTAIVVGLIIFLCVRAIYEALKKEDKLKKKIKQKK